VQVVGRRAFVWRGALYNRYSVVDLRSGRQLRTLPGRDALVALIGAGPPFYG
jgi:hypothetical protein